MIAKNRACQNRISGIFKAVSGSDNLVCEIEMFFGMHSIPYMLLDIGRPAGDMDVLVAATAMVAGHSLIARDLSGFAHFPELAAESY